MRSAGRDDLGGERRFVLAGGVMGIGFVLKVEKRFTLGEDLCLKGDRRDICA